MFRDLLANSLTCIRNAVRVRKRNVKIYVNDVIIGILDILSEGGFIKGYKIETGQKGSRIADIELKYSDGPVIKEIKQISRQSRRVYAKNTEIPRIYNNLGTVIVSTSSGIMTGKQARDAKLGGELLCSVF
ncbi:MAG: 30S ribosomal protein S8 [Cytophagales bacterium]|nr:30S ribosomal protein S8 [Cytophagales bacterium]